MTDQQQAAASAVVAPEATQAPIASSTALKICFMRLCDFSEWIFTTTENRRRRFQIEHPTIDPPWKTSLLREKEQHDELFGETAFHSHQHQYQRNTNTNRTGSSKNLKNNFNHVSPPNIHSMMAGDNGDQSSQQRLARLRKLHQDHCTLEAALVALSALDEQTAQQYVLEELQYYVLIQTVLHGDPLAETITVPEASLLFKTKARKPLISIQSFERLFGEGGSSTTVDEQGMQRLDALLDVQKAMYNKIAFLEDREEVFSRDQIIQQFNQEAAELLSQLRRMKEVVELRAQLSRATNRKIEQAQVLSSLGALHLESVKKDVAKAVADSENAKKLASAIETTIATARNTAEALSEETGINSRFFEEEKNRVVRDCQEGCREVLNLAQDRWSMLDLRMERLERLMTSVGRSALVCSMTHLPLAEHQKLLLAPVEAKSSSNRKQNNNNRNDDDDSILDQSLEWLKLSTTERFGLMSSCHVLREHDPQENLVTSAVALTLSDNCVFSTSKISSSQLDAAVLGSTVAFLGLSENVTSKLFLLKSKDALTPALDTFVRSTVSPGLLFDRFLSSLAVELPGGAGNNVGLWRAAQQRPDNNNTFSAPTMIHNTRNPKLNSVTTLGMHNRYHPSTQSTFRVGITPMDYSVMAGTTATTSSNAKHNNNNDVTVATTNSSKSGLEYSPIPPIGNDTTTILLSSSGSHHRHSYHSKFSDAQAIIDAASAVTLAEFVRIMTDVARIYLGPAASGCSPEFCLHILCQWKITPLCPLLPLLTTSLLLRTAGKKESTSSLERYQKQQQEERKPLTEPRFCDAWNRLVGNSSSSSTQNNDQTSNHHHNNNGPSLGDVASFLLAHFPDVIAASRGWDSSARAGFSGSELYVVRCVLFVLLVVGMRRNALLRVDVAEYDFVRYLGDYKTNNKTESDNNTGIVNVEVDLKPIQTQEMLNFISSRPCPWNFIVAAWPENNNNSQQGNTNNADNTALLPFVDDSYLFKKAIEEAGLPSEVLQSLPAWETIVGVVKRAEQSIAMMERK